MPQKHHSFKGNKSFLPSKPCSVCHKPMTWRKRWANNWESVKYCSNACRARGSLEIQTHSTS